MTTGPITVPFIMALGIGMASVRSDKNSNSDSFGLISMCSIGPILAVLLLGIFYKPSESAYTPAEIPEIITTKDAARQFATGLPIYAEEVLVALCPIVILFVIFQIVFRRFHMHPLIKISSGMIYTYIGLVLFLTGVNVGFMPAGQFIGASVAVGTNKWLLIPIGMIIGYFIVKAEPAVQVLTKQVEEVSNGSITQKSIQHGLSIGVASGPMTATFLLPMAMGACEALGGNILTDAFGIVAMVAMTPLVTIQLLGLIGKIKK